VANSGKIQTEVYWLISGLEGRTVDEWENKSKVTEHHARHVYLNRTEDRGQCTIAITGNSKIGWENVDWIHLAQDRDRRRTVVNTVMNHRVP
jgi:hypothetical protein